MASRWQNPRHYGNGAGGTSGGSSSARIRNEDSLLRRFGVTCGNRGRRRLPQGSVGSASRKPVLEPARPGDSSDPPFLELQSHKPSAPGAIVVNTARGGLVVDDDLIAALKSGRVAAAGLDVFEGEPKLHPDYVSLKNTFLLPHIGSATIETRTAMGMLALDNVEAVLNGGPAPTLVPGRQSGNCLTH